MRKLKTGRIKKEITSKYPTICIMQQSIPAAPSNPLTAPHPRATAERGSCPPCESWGCGICKFCTARGPGICQPRGQPRAFDTHAVSYQNITTQRILLEKQADWLICQGWEKNEEVYKGMFSILMSIIRTIRWFSRNLGRHK